MSGKSIFLSWKTLKVSDDGLVSGKAVDVTSENNRDQQSSLF